ncbi:peptide ABC transporter permease, partial [Pseudomonas aeruginosa]|nr:peptide ABC transporter permease [Pseudomonas aeruginosa]
MGGYLLRRLALILPTLLGILLINFAIVQAAPGGPVDQAIARLQGVDGGGPLGRGGDCLLYTSDAADEARSVDL